MQLLPSLIGDQLSAYGARRTGPSIQLSNASLAENSTDGTAVGNLSVINGTGTWVFSLTDNAGSRFKVAGTNGVNLQASTNPTDYEGATSHNITVQATNGTTTINRIIAISVTNVDEGVLPTPVLTWVTPSNDNTPTMNAAVPIGIMIAGDTWVIEFATNSLFTGATQLSGTVSSPDAIDGDIDAPSMISLPEGINYARFRVLRSAVAITNWSNTASSTINAPPVMTSSNTFSMVEANTIVATLTADQACTFAIGGTDAAFFQIVSGNSLRFISAPSFSSPGDAGANNIYDITITPTAVADSEAGSPQSVAVTVTPIGDYAATTAFLARAVTSGGTVSSRLDATHIAAVKAFINGLNSDNIWNNFDAIYLLATQTGIGADNKDIMRLNLVQNLYNLTGSGGTFTADQGWTDAGGSSPHSTNFTPSTASSPKFVLNDAHVMVWTDTSNSANTDFGVNNGGGFSGCGQSTTQAAYGLNQSGSRILNAASSALGFVFAQRKAASGAAAVELYRAEPTDSAAALVDSGTNASTSLSSAALTVGAVAGQSYSGKRQSAASIGKSMSAADVSKFFVRLKAYMTAIGNT
jgi:hypothetical protein